MCEILITIWTSTLASYGSHSLQGCTNYGLCDHPAAVRGRSSLRLVSWLSFQLTERCLGFIREAMRTLCSKTPAPEVGCLELAHQFLPPAPLTTAETVRNFLISEVSLAGMATRPDAVRELFQTFLRRMNLPRLVHFLDLVLPQIVPLWETSAGKGRSRLHSSHSVD